MGAAMPGTRMPRANVPRAHHCWGVDGTRIPVSPVRRRWIQARMPASSRKEVTYEVSE